MTQASEIYTRVDTAHEETKAALQAAQKAASDLVVHKEDIAAHGETLPEIIAVKIAGELENMDSGFNAAIENQVQGLIRDMIANGDLDAGDTPSTPTLVVAMPVITLPETLVAGVAITISIKAGLVNTNDITGFLLSVNGGEQIRLQATDGVASYPLTVPSGTALAITCKAVDSLGNVSKPAELSKPIVKGIIKTPSLTSPVNGSEVVIGGGELVLVSSDFAMQVGTDTHGSSDWGLWKDAAMNEVVAQALASADLTTHTFTSLSLDAGVTYYAGVRHNGASGIKSEFGTIGFVAKNGIVAPSGHVLWAIDDAVCFQYDDGTGMKTLAVALAKDYASALEWQNTLTDIAGMTNYSNSDFRITAGMTDAQLNAVGFNDASTARSNTTNMKSAGSPAADHARSKTIGGVACDIPNIQQMKRIWVLRSEIDALDPTSAPFSSSALAGWDFGGNCVWPSTEASASSGWYVHLNGGCNKISGKDRPYGVIPVLELS